MTGGWTPSVHLFSQSRGKLRFDAATRTFLPGPAGAGHAKRRRLRAACSTSPRRWPTARARARRRRRAGAGRAEGYDASTGGTVGLVAPMAEEKLAKAFVDYQNDVTARDIKLATREGMKSIEHIKRYTTTGMATDQGKTSNMNALAIAAESLGREIAEVGLTTFRLPYTPVTFGIFARAVEAARCSIPCARRRSIPGMSAKDAVWEEAGLWKRATPRAAAGREHRQTRPARVPDHAAQGRDHGRLHARQDRGRRPRRGGVPQPAVRERLHQARRRALPLRADAQRAGLHLRRRRRDADGGRTGSTSPPPPAARRMCSR